MIEGGAPAAPWNLPGRASLVAYMLKEGTRRQSSAELAERIDGNPVAGAIPVEQVLGQLERGLEAFGG